ncbi:MAG: hypothetical protein ABJQ89_21025, partial [Planktotalea sp.]
RGEHIACTRVGSLIFVSPDISSYFVPRRHFIDALPEPFVPLPGNDLGLSGFDAALLIAFTATKDIDHRTETNGRIWPRCGTHRVDQWADT